jgi:hypothetical protein
MKTLMIIFLLISIRVYGQTQFQRAIGGNGDESSYSIIQTTDGGYAIAGYSRTYSSPGDYGDFYIVKLNTNGLIQWTRNVGGTGTEYGLYIIQTTDGGYAVAGYTNSYGAGDFDFYIVKLDSSGTLQWNRTIGGAANDRASCIVQTTDGGYAVIGRTNSFGAGNFDMFLVRLNSNGTLRWSRTLGGLGAEGEWSLIKTIDGGFALSGSTASFGAGLNDMYMVKLDSGGTVLWSRTVGGSNLDYGGPVLQCPDSSYVLAGDTRSFGAGLYDMYLVKFDVNGNLIWNKTIGGTTDESCSAMIQTTDGGYAICGFIDVAPYYGCIVKVNSSGIIQWTKRTLNDTYSIVKTSDGGYALTGAISDFGSGSSDYCIIKFDAGWNTCGSISISTFNVGSGGTISSPVSLVNSPTPTVTTPSPTTGTGGILTSMCGVTGVQQETTGLPKEYSLSQNYPNPFNPATKINYSIPKQGLVMLKVYDIFGREVKTLVNDVLTSGDYTVEFEGSNLSSGIYFYKLKSGNFSETQRMVLIK